MVPYINNVWLTSKKERLYRLKNGAASDTSTLKNWIGRKLNPTLYATETGL